MKRYHIHINFKNGDELDANVTARNQADAIKRLQNTPQFVENFGNVAIEKMSVTPIPIASIDNERFAVTNIPNKPGWYAAVDLDNLLKVEFKRGKYNDTNTISHIGEGKQLTPLQQATALREIGEFLFNNFKELI